MVQAVAEDFRDRTAVGSYFAVHSSCMWSDARQESLPRFVKPALPAIASTDELGPDCEELRPIAAAAEGGLNLVFCRLVHSSPASSHKATARRTDRWVSDGWGGGRSGEGPGLGVMAYHPLRA